jgi:hypothetical protein
VRAGDGAAGPPQCPSTGSFSCRDINKRSAYFSEHVIPVDILKVSLLTSDKYFLDPTKGKSEKGLF